MFEDKAQCIANCLMTERGAHVLYRHLGLAEVDSHSAWLSRRHIKDQIVTYFPNVKMESLVVNSVDVNGQFAYTVTFKD